MNNVGDIIEVHVVGKLEDAFGKAVALMILASATRQAGVPTSELSHGEFLRLVDAICCDQRCLDMWGEAGAVQVKQQWESLV